MAQADFGNLFDRLIHERCRSAAAFCRGCEAYGLEISESTVSRVIHGKAPNLKEIDVWARVLRLSAAEKVIFKEEAQLANSPEEVAARIQKLVSLSEEQALIIADLTVRLDAVTAQHQPRRAARTPPASR